MGSSDLYNYEPSLPAAVIFLVAYLLTTAIHTFQLFRFRAWICIPIVIGGYLEWIGYVGRIIGHTQAPDNYELGPFILQALLLLIAPSFVAATIYMILGRVILLTDGEDVALIRKKWLTKIFVTGDVICFLVQAGGGSLQANDNQDSRKIGQWIVVAGLLLQLVLFGLFVLVAIHFHVKIRKHPTLLATNSEVPWSKHMYMLYIVSVLIFIRCAYRLVEYIQGFDGYLFSHEVFAYCLDGLPILAAMIVVNFIHPHDITTSLKQRMAARDHQKMPSSDTNSDIRMV